MRRKLIKNATEDDKRSVNLLISYANELFKNIKAKQNKLLMLEGRILIEEALKVDCVAISTIFYTSSILKLSWSKNENKEFLNNFSKLKMIKINPKLMNTLSQVENNQGLLGKNLFYLRVKFEINFIF